MSEIKRLNQQTINQIAAGEVVERPASVVKELMENAIDAGATQIDVIITDGGLTKIEIKDNGKGILTEDLSTALERYATSKLTTSEDLESINTYGFRGEALAAISAISKTTILTTRNGSTNSITSNNGNLSKITPGSRSQGTTIVIENLFESVPARQKFMKSADTEYKYILKTFTQFALLNGKIHFTLTNNGKEVYNLPSSEIELLPKERVAKIYSLNPSELLPIQHEEYGIKVQGYLVHPKLLTSNSKFLVSFINNRPVEDKGIFKAMQQGISDFVPDFFKPTGIVSVSLSSEQVDVNVHPRKTEVKLINPFRVYAAVTHAVKASLQTNLAQPGQQIAYKPQMTSTFSSFSTKPSQWDKKQDNAYDRLRGSQQQLFFKVNP
ncbi:DNA mismatch repair endonuclease MutL, partial [bacterium]|nr:DNA mismatch repair endonuclease MutL [bacterium]